MKKLFIMSGALGDYNLIDKTLNDNQFDMSNDSHILVFLGDMIGPHHNYPIEVISLYYNLASRKRMFYILGKQEQMLKTFLNTNANVDAVRNFIVEDNFLATLSALSSRNVTIFNQEVLTSILNYINSQVHNLTYNYRTRGMPNSIKEMFDGLPLYLETQHYLLSYGDLSGLNKNELTFDRLAKSANEQIFNLELPKPMIIGKNHTNEVGEIVQEIVNARPNERIAYNFLGSNDPHGIFMLQDMGRYSHNRAKYYINSNATMSKKLNIFIIEDELIEPEPIKAEEQKKEPEVETTLNNGYVNATWFDTTGMAQAMGAVGTTTANAARAGAIRFDNNGDIFIMN